MKRIFLILLTLFSVSTVHAEISESHKQENTNSVSSLCYNLDKECSVTAFYNQKTKMVEVKGSGKIDKNVWTKYLEDHKIASSGIGIEFISDGIIMPEDCSYFFKDITGDIILPKTLDTSEVKNMRGMFYGANNANPDVSNWNTSNVTNMGSMFKYNNIANPDVSNWDVSKVEYMTWMFNYAPNANPNTTKWKTSSLKDAYQMYDGTKNIKQITLMGKREQLLDATYLYAPNTLEDVEFEGLTGTTGFYMNGSYIVENITKNTKEGPFKKEYRYKFIDGDHYHVYIVHSEADSFNPKINEDITTILVNSTIDVVKKTIANLPSNIQKFEVLNQNDLNSIGEKELNIKITFRDNSTTEFKIKVNIIAPKQEVKIENPKTGITSPRLLILFLISIILITTYILLKKELINKEI